MRQRFEGAAGLYRSRGRAQSMRRGDAERGKRVYAARKGFCRTGHSVGTVHAGISLYLGAAAVSPDARILRLVRGFCAVRVFRRTGHAVGAVCTGFYRAVISVGISFAVSLHGFTA